MKPYAEALKQARKVGAAHADGDALAAQNASVVGTMRGLRTPAVRKIYAHLAQDPKNLETIRRLLDNTDGLVFDIILA